MREKQAAAAAASVAAVATVDAGAAAKQASIACMKVKGEKSKLTNTKSRRHLDELLPNGSAGSLLVGLPNTVVHLRS